MPGIDENDAKVFKMTGVAGRERCFARGGDTGDLDVADLNRPADLPLLGGDYGRGFRRSPVERQYAAAIAARQRQIGWSVEIRDVQIAGITAARKATLATRNTRHFENLGIILVDPWHA